MSWVYENYKSVYSHSAGFNIRCHNLTFKADSLTQVLIKILLKLFAEYVQLSACYFVFYIIKINLFGEYFSNWSCVSNYSAIV